jgi:hypothetical protein
MRLTGRQLLLLLSPAVMLLLLRRVWLRRSCTPDEPPPPSPAMAGVLNNKQKVRTEVLQSRKSLKIAGMFLDL